MNQNVDFSSTWPDILSTLDLYDHSQSLVSGNYAYEAILFSGHYYANNNNVLNKDWTTNMNSLFNSSNKFNYTTINNTRFLTLKFVRNLTTNTLKINFTNNSANDKVLFVKFVNNSNLESVWFDCDKGFDNYYIFNSARVNGEGIRLNKKKLDEQNIACPTGNNMIIYLCIKIPSNLNSKFEYISIDNTFQGKGF